MAKVPMTPRVQQTLELLLAYLTRIVLDDEALQEWVHDRACARVGLSPETTIGEEDGECPEQIRNPEAETLDPSEQWIENPQYARYYEVTTELYMGLLARVGSKLTFIEGEFPTG